MAPKLFICLLPPHWHSLYPTHVDLHNFDSPNDGKFFISYTFIIYFHLLPLPQHLSWFHLPTHRLACPCRPPRRQRPKQVLFGPGKFFISFIYFCLLPLPQHLSWFHLPTHCLACPCRPPWHQRPKRVLFGPGKFFISFIYFRLLPLPQHLLWFHLPTHRLACPCWPPQRQRPKRVLFGPGVRITTVWIFMWSENKNFPCSWL